MGHSGRWHLVMLGGNEVLVAMCQVALGCVRWHLVCVAKCQVAPLPMYSRAFQSIKQPLINTTS